jgi:Mg2+/Co2+ transporter CorB
LDDISLGTLLIALAALLIIAGFFSIAETSMMAVNRYRLKALAKRAGHAQRGARQTLELLAKTDKLLGLVLLGNTVINAAAATLTTIVTVRLFGQHEWTLAASTIVISFVILVFSEITPKVAGAAYAERIAPVLSYVLRPLMWLSNPVIWFVNLFVRAILRLFRLRSTAERGVMSQEELRSLVLEGSHYLPPKHHSILLNLFELEKITVDDVMAPRNQIDALDLDTDPESLRRQIVTSNHTRIPVYRGGADNVVGIMHVRQVLQLVKEDEWNVAELEAILRPAYFIPSGTPLLAQLQHFQENQQRLGLIVDEYGELLGLVTVEDIIEEIIGEYTTQSPTSGDNYRREEDGSIVVEGASLLRNLNRKLGTQFPLDGPKTLNGLILEHLGDIPEAGLSVKIGSHTVEILHTQDRVVKVARLRPAEPVSPGIALQSPDEQASSKDRL